MDNIAEKGTLIAIGNFLEGSPANIYSLNICGVRKKKYSVLKCLLKPVNECSGWVD